MSPRLVNGVDTSAADEHAWCRESVPWYVNDTLDQRQRQRVDAHAVLCVECRADIAAGRLLSTMLDERGSVELAPQGGLAAVLRRIERREAWRRRVAPPLLMFFGEHAQRPLALAVAVQSLVIVILTAVLGFVLQPPRGAAYRTLSTPTVASAAGQRLRLVLDDSVTSGELRELLLPWKGRIIGGPAGHGIYTIAIEGEPEDAARQLRQHRGVRLAEWIVEP